MRDNLYMQRLGPNNFRVFVRRGTQVVDGSEGPPRAIHGLLKQYGKKALGAFTKFARGSTDKEEVPIVLASGASSVEDVAPTADDMIERVLAGGTTLDIGSLLDKAVGNPLIEDPPQSSSTAAESVDLDTSLKRLYLERSRALKKSIRAYSAGDTTEEARENGISMGLELAINVLTGRRFDSLRFPR